jgi:hypothetical protein
MSTASNRRRAPGRIVAGVAGFIAVASLCMAARAEPVPIVSYDVDDTPRSGWGGWAHAYTGTITDTGRTVAGFSGTGDGNNIANYAGGSGSLNDGVIDNGISGTQLFTNRNADDGSPINPVVTLHLGSIFLIDAIRTFGSDTCCNIIPGALDHVTVALGGSSLGFATIPFGPPNALGVPADDLIDVASSALAALATDTIVLRNFQATFFGPFDQFSISEITVQGTPAAGVPEPGSLALLAACAVLVAAACRRRERSIPQGFATT